MHFYCTCGKRISDTTDFLSYKAHFLADQDLEDYYNAIEQEVKNEGITRDECVSNIVITHGVKYLGRAIYQCEACGRLFIDDENGNNFHVFAPEKEESKRVLLSKEGENWKGFLYAEWYDEKPEWSECNGYIDVNVNRPYKSVHFNSKEEFEREYYRLFEELKTKEIIRSASMKINKEWVHSWNL